MNLSEFREQYPQYDGVSDGNLATALYGKYYKDTMSSAHFVDSIGLKKDTISSAHLATLYGKYYPGEGKFAGEGEIRSPLRWPTFKAFMGGSAQGLLVEESMAREMINVLTGSTDKEKEDAKEAYFDDPVNRQLNEIASVLDELEAAGMQDTPKYQDWEGQFNELRARQGEKTPEFSMSSFVAAAKEDPGAVGAELANVIMADPYLALTPLGWEKAAASAALKLAKYGSRVQRIGSVSAGAAAAATTGAVVVAPISVFEQLNENGTVDEARLASEVGLGALGSATLGAIWRGLKHAGKATAQAKAKFYANAEDDLVGAINEHLRAHGISNVPDEVLFQLPAPAQRRLLTYVPPKLLTGPKMSGTFEVTPAGVAKRLTSAQAEAQRKAPTWLSGDESKLTLEQKRYLDKNPGRRPAQARPMYRHEERLLAEARAGRRVNNSMRFPGKQVGEVDPALLAVLAAGGIGAATALVLGGDQKDASGAAILGMGATLAARKLYMVGKSVSKTIDDGPKIRASKLVDDWDKRTSDSSLANYRLQQHINEAVPDQVARENITHFMEGKKVKLTPEEIKVANEMKNWFRMMGEHGKREGVLGDLLDNYVTHIWKQPGQKTEDVIKMFRGKSMSPKTKFSKQRVIPDYQTGIDMGLEPVTLDIGQIAKIYAESLNRAIANKRLITSLKNEGLIVPTKGAPKDWPSINHPQLQGLRVEPNIVPSLRFVFQNTDPNLIVESLVALNFAMKRSLVSLSAFHLNALVESSIFALGHPMHTLKLLRGTHPVFQMLKYGKAGDEVNLMLRNGLKIGRVEDVGGDSFYSTMEMLAKWADKQLPGGGVVPREYIKVNKFIDKIMWDRYLTGIKLIVSLKELEKAKLRNLKMHSRNPSKYPLRSTEVIAGDIAEYVNDAFGGLDWRRIAERTRGKKWRDIKMAAFSPKGRMGLQLGLFAPDWTIANLRVALKAIPGMARNKFIGSLHRKYLARQLLFIATAVNGVNYMMSGKFMWENDNPTRIDLGDGREMVASKQAFEPFHWITKPGKTALNKMGVFPATVMEQIMNVQWLSATGAPRIREKDDTLLQNVADTATHLGKKFVPIGLQQMEEQGVGAGLAGLAGHPIYIAPTKSWRDSRSRRD